MAEGSGVVYFWRVIAAWFDNICVAPGILALVPESPVQTELGIDEQGRVLAATGERYEPECRRERAIGKRFGRSWANVRLLMVREDPAKVEIPLKSSGVEACR